MITCRLKTDQVSINRRLAEHTRSTHNGSCWCAMDFTAVKKRKGVRIRLLWSTGGWANSEALFARLFLLHSYNVGKSNFPVPSAVGRGQITGSDAGLWVECVIHFQGQHRARRVEWLSRDLAVLHCWQFFNINFMTASGFSWRVQASLWLKSMLSYSETCGILVLQPGIKPTSPAL